MSSDYKEIIGMVHLKPLLRITRDASGWIIVDAALEDLKSLEAGGITTAIVENMFDAPYAARQTLKPSSRSPTSGLSRAQNQRQTWCEPANWRRVEPKEMSIASVWAGFHQAESFVGDAYELFRAYVEYVCRLKCKKQLCARMSVCSLTSTSKHSYHQQSIDDLIYEAIEGGRMALSLQALLRFRAFCNRRGNL